MSTPSPCPFEIGRSLSSVPRRMTVPDHASTRPTNSATSSSTVSACGGVPEVERQAHQFAAAFLTPEEDIAPDLPDRADWQRLFALKRKWQVSLAALLMRARVLGRMSEGNYVTAVKVASARGWRRSKPVPLGVPEQPQLLRTLLHSSSGRGYRELLPIKVLDQLEGAVGA